MHIANATPPYEWIFSGIGVAVLSGFGAWLYRRYRRVAVPGNVSKVKISESTVIGPVAGRDISIGTFVQHEVTPEPPSDEYRATPTTGEIAAAIERVPLYLRGSVANSYSGLKVRWQGQISNIRRLDGGEIDVIFEISDNTPCVVLRVKLEDYPILKTVHGGEPAEVSGTIDWVQENTLVYLKDAKLRFPP